MSATTQRSDVANKAVLVQPATERSAYDRMSGIEETSHVSSELQDERRSEEGVEEEPEIDYENPFRYMFYR